MNSSEAFLALVGTEIRLRVERGLDVPTAARLSGLSEERLAAFEAAEDQLTLEEIERVADAFGVTAAVMFGAAVPTLADYA